MYHIQITKLSSYNISEMPICSLFTEGTHAAHCYFTRAPNAWNHPQSALPWISTLLLLYLTGFGRWARGLADYPFVQIEKGDQESYEFSRPTGPHGVYKGMHTMLFQRSVSHWQGLRLYRTGMRTLCQSLPKTGVREVWGKNLVYVLYPQRCDAPKQDLEYRICRRVEDILCPSCSVS